MSFYKDEENNDYYILELKEWNYKLFDKDQANNLGNDN